MELKFLIKSNKTAKNTPAKCVYVKSKQVESINHKSQKVHEKILSCFACIIYVPKVSGISYLKLLSPKQMLQRSSIAIAQLKASNTSGNLLNESLQMINSLCCARRIAKRVHNHVINSKELSHKMDILFIYP